jgi:hypothetical protein
MAEYKKINPMLTDFPQFKNLELNDKDDIESITKKYPPYSDFNFISMWAWDIKGEMRVSKLNGNLVVKFNDYITGEPFYSFLGDNKVNETIESLLELSKKEGFKPVLKLLPEIVLKDLDTTKYAAEEDPNQFDYIYNIEKISTYEGKEFETKRNLLNRFIREYPNGVAKICNLQDPTTLEQILNLITLWEHKKITHSSDARVENELSALHRMLVVSKEFELFTIGIFSDTKLLSFCVNEFISVDMALSHFAKADGSSSGLYSFLMKENAKFIKKQNIKYLNYEQDLGIANLKHAKSSFRPEKFFKKIICTYKS